MLNNIGLPGLMLLVLLIGLPVWLIVRSSKRKSKEQARIAEALENLAKTKKQ
jgi:preprotein translocase subunit YajC